MRRILVFSTAYLPLVGGAEIAVKELTSRLYPGFSFVLITARLDPKLPLKEKIGSVEVYRVGFGAPIIDKLVLPFVGAFKAFKIINEQGIDVFWSVMVSFASFAPIFINWSRSVSGKPRIPIVLSLQEGDSEEHLRKARGGLIDLSWKFVLKNTDIITAISNYLLDRAIRYVFTSPTVLVPNGVDVKLFGRPASVKEFDLIKKKFGKKDGDIVIVTVSRLVKKNAVDDLIRSLAELPQHVKLWIIGEGEERKTLEGITRRMRLEDRVSFIGEVGHRELPALIQSCDIFVRPSRSEGFGNVFVEAMAAGIPVIATPVGGIVDFLFDPDKNPNQNPTGLFCEVNNSSSVARQIKRLLENPALREQIVLSAKKLVEEKYDWAKIAQLMSIKVFGSFKSL